MAEKTTHTKHEAEPKEEKPQQTDREKAVEAVAKALETALKDCNPADREGIVKEAMAKLTAAKPAAGADFSPPKPEEEKKS